MPKKDYEDIIKKSMNIDDKNLKETSAFRLQDWIVNILFTIITIVLLIQVHVYGQKEHETLSWIFLILTVILYVASFLRYKQNN